MMLWSDTQSIDHTRVSDVSKKLNCGLSLMYQYCINGLNLAVSRLRQTVARPCQCLPAAPYQLHLSRVHTAPYICSNPMFAANSVMSAQLQHYSYWEERKTQAI